MTRLAHAASRDWVCRVRTFSPNARSPVIWPSRPSRTRRTMLVPSAPASSKVSSTESETGSASSARTASRAGELSRPARPGARSGPSAPATVPARTPTARPAPRARWRYRPAALRSHGAARPATPRSGRWPVAPLRRPIRVRHGPDRRGGQQRPRSPCGPRRTGPGTPRPGQPADTAQNWAGVTAAPAWDSHTCRRTRCRRRGGRAERVQRSGRPATASASSHTAAGRAQRGQHDHRTTSLRPG